MPSDADTARPGSHGNGHRFDDEPAVEAHPWEQARTHLGELIAYLNLWLAARLDLLKVSVRRLVIFTLFGVVALLAATAVVVTAAALLVIGLAQWLAAMLGGRMWAGNLIAGVVVFVTMLLMAWWLVRKIFGSSLHATVKRYERKLKQQRARYGSDARQRSAEHAARQ